MNTASLIWVMISAALVLFMIPGLSLFYGGMDNSRNALNMILMSFHCVLAIPILWMIIGYSLAHGNGTFIGDLHHMSLNNVNITDDDGMTLATIAFLGMFAAITPGRLDIDSWCLCGEPIRWSRRNCFGMALSCQIYVMRAII